MNSRIEKAGQAIAISIFAFWAVATIFFLAWKLAECWRQP